MVIAIACDYYIPSMYFVSLGRIFSGMLHRIFFGILVRIFSCILHRVLSCSLDRVTSVVFYLVNRVTIASCVIHRSHQTRPLLCTLCVD